MAYTKLNWTNGGPPALNDVNLNHMDTGIYNAHQSIDTALITVVSSVAAAYTASSGELVLADASGGAFTVTLPTPVQGGRVDVKKTDSSSNAVTISQNGTETIDGVTSINISAQYESYSFVSDGTNWFII